MCQVIFILVIIAASMNSGYALQCWKCNSEYDVTCRDHFNVTRIHQNRMYQDNVNYETRQIQPMRNDPHLEMCDERFVTTYNQKNVCLKRVRTGSNGLPHVIRECRLVSRNLKVGNCPEELYDSSKSTNFCGTCEYDGCNLASGLKNSIILTCTVPTMLLLLLQKN